MKQKKFIFFLIFTAIFSWLPFFNISIFSIKPNFALIFIALLAAFVPELLEGIFLVTFYAFLLKFSPHPDKEILITLILGLALIVLRRFLPVDYSLKFLIGIILSTIIFYIFLGFSLISWIFVGEILYNAIIGSIVFFVLSRFKFIKGFA